MKKFMWLIAGLMMLIAPSAHAREGMYLGVFVPSTSWSGDVSGVDSGTGLGGRLGLGFGRYVAIEGAMFKSTHDVGSTSWDFKGTTVDLKIHFPLSGSDFEPYILWGLGKYELGPYKGEGNQLGLGFNFYLFPELSLNAGYTMRDITFDEGTGGVDVDGKARTIDVGLTYRFL